MPAAAPVAFGLAIAGVAACAMKSPEPLAKPHPTKMPVESLSVDPLSGPRQEIVALSTQIRQWRLDVDLSVEPPPDAVMAMSEVSAATAAETCSAAPATGTCHDVCELGDAICDNAVTICSIAEQLEGDDWAREKCDSAKASCREAEERCCTCRQPAGMP